MDDQSYEQERKASLDAEYSDAEHYDKWLITLSSGGFGISIAFIRYIAPHPTTTSKWFLAVAWVSLLLSIISTMASLQCSQSGFRRYRDILDQMKRGNAKSDHRNLPAKTAKILNWISLVLFSVGAAMLAIFSYVNLGGKT